MADIVVGSGPSGVAAATALLERGRSVTMIDVGIALEPEREALRARLGGVPPADWSDADRSALAGSRHAHASDTMLAFGSDFIMRRPAGQTDWDSPANVHDLAPSFARGGLSNGWGAATLPYRAEDIADWPLGIAELAPHYRAVARLAKATGGTDDLTPLFPALPPEEERFLPMSRQAEQLLARFGRRRSALEASGVRLGRARQAVAPDCRRCGQCLHGCPYRLIFTAGDALSALQTSERFSYLPGHYVRSFAEANGKISVETDKGRIEGDRLFLGAGVLPTALITLRSLGNAAGSVVIKDSAHSYLPMLHPWSAGRPDREAKHTLAQLFLEIADPAVSPHTVHAQIYTHNDTYAPDMRRRFGALARPAEPLIQAMSRRLVVAQTFLHSDDSSAIGMRLSVSGRLEFEAIANPAQPAAQAHAASAVARAARQIGLFPLMPLLRAGRLGSSFHCGGSFPMRAVPGALETDALGRLQGFERVHLIDASTFPSIPATTITLSVMANAHRIATASF
jgi:choline dehydrogenase-like flavoprotein